MTDSTVPDISKIQAKNYTDLQMCKFNSFVIFVNNNKKGFLSRLHIIPLALTAKFLLFLHKVHMEGASENIKKLVAAFVEG
jgi:hypothetical protein